MDQLLYSTVHTQIFQAHYHSPKILKLLAGAMSVPMLSLEVLNFFPDLMPILPVLLHLLAYVVISSFSIFLHIFPTFSSFLSTSGPESTCHYFVFQIVHKTAHVQTLSILNFLSLSHSLATDSKSVLTDLSTISEISLHRA
jgi:hypothetical protein